MEGKRVLAAPVQHRFPPPVVAALSPYAAAVHAHARGLAVTSRPPEMVKAIGYRHMFRRVRSVILLPRHPPSGPIILPKRPVTPQI